MESAGEAYVNITANITDLKNGLEQASIYCTNYGNSIQAAEKFYTLRLKTDTSVFEKNLKTSLENFYQYIAKAKKWIESLDDFMTKTIVNKSKALVAHVGTILALTGPFTMLGDKFDKMAQRTGLTTEYLSRMSHAANLCGSSIESIEGATKSLQVNLLAATNGSTKAKQAFDLLGISASVKFLLHI